MAVIELFATSEMTAERWIVTAAVLVFCAAWCFADWLFDGSDG